MSDLRSDIIKVIYKHCADCNCELEKEFLMPLCQSEADEIMDYVRPLIKSTNIAMASGILHQIESMLSLYESRDTGYIEISNHVPMSSWEELKKEFGVT